MAGKSTRDILVEDLQFVSHEMCKQIPNGEEWWQYKIRRDLLLYVIGDIDRKRIKEENRD